MLKSKNETSHSDCVWTMESDKSHKESHLHNVLVFLQRRGEFSNLLTQGGAVFLSCALSQSLPTDGVGWSLEGRKKQAVTD